MVTKTKVKKKLRPIKTEVAGKFLGILENSPEL